MNVLIIKKHRSLKNIQTTKTADFFLFSESSHNDILGNISKFFQFHYLHFLSTLLRHYIYIYICIYLANLYLSINLYDNIYIHIMYLYTYTYIHFYLTISILNLSVLSFLTLQNTICQKYATDFEAGKIFAT